MRQFIHLGKASLCLFLPVTYMMYEPRILGRISDGSNKAVQLRLGLGHFLMTDSAPTLLLIPFLNFELSTQRGAAALILHKPNVDSSPQSKE